MKKKISLFCATLILLFGTLNLTAHSVYSLEGDGEVSGIIDEYVQALGNDWEKVSGLFVDEKKDIYLDMWENGAIEQHRGMFNIISARLIEKKEVAYKDVKENLGLEEKEENIRTFVVGIDYEVYENTQFYWQGIAYTIMAFTKEENNWKIAAVSFIEDPEGLQEKGYEFTSDYASCIRSMENRKKGLLTDGYGKVFGKLFENTESQIVNSDNEIAIIEGKYDTNKMEFKENASVQAAHTSHPVPTLDTKINYLRTERTATSAAEIGIKKDINFYDFCLGCTGCEVGSSNFDGIARQANVIAIKTFVWHYCIIPKDPNGEYHLNDWQIAYRPYDEIGNVNMKAISRDFQAVRQIWMESASGAIFEANFKKGDYSNQGKNGGELKQEGSRYLANNGYSRLDILHYYYDNSKASQAGPVQFFYTSGGPCYK